MGSYETRPRWVIADVLDRTDLGALLDQLAQPAALRMGPGRRWHCPAPDHDDHRASVTMHRDRHGHERWRCWSADHRGDAVDLVMLVTGRDRVDAVDWLATHAGMHPDRPLPPIPARRPAASPAVTVSPLVEQYVDACHRILHTRAGRPVLDWLHHRGLDDTTVAANRLGADPGRTVLHRARGLPYGADVAAVLPALDPAGRVAYVQARYLHPDTTGRKYDNPAAALAPHRRIAHPAGGDDRAGVLLVCEGLPDALVATQAGYRSVALLGATTPDESVAARIANHADNHHLAVGIVCDPDPAGRHATGTLTALLDRLGVDALTVTPPDACDLNAWALTDPHWAARLDTALTDPGVELGWTVER
jgi:DNA primase